MDEACDSFRDFIRSKGISDALASALESLHRLRRKPKNPIEFIRQNLPPVQEDTIADLTNELEALKKDIQNIRKRLPEKKIPEPEIEVTEEDSENEEHDDIEQAEFESKPDESKLIATDTNVEHVQVASGDIVQNEIDISPTEHIIEDLIDQVSNGVEPKAISVHSTNDETK